MPPPGTGSFCQKINIWYSFVQDFLLVHPLIVKESEMKMSYGSRRTRRTRKQYEAIAEYISRGLEPRIVHLIQRGSKTTLEDFRDLGIPVEKGRAIRKLQGEIRTCGLYHAFASA